MSTDVLTADDPLYEELYDIRREAEDIGNLVEEDVNPGFARLREEAPVHEGAIRDLLGLPDHVRYKQSTGRRKFSVFGFDAVEEVFRKSGIYSSSIVHHDNPDNEKTMGILEMDGKEHIAYRKTLQPMFIKPRTRTWWRERWIDEIVEALIVRLKTQDRAELNLEYCARVPVHTVTRGIGIDGDNSLTFRRALLISGGSGVATMEERMEASKTVYRMLHELVDQRRKEPGDDVVTGLINATLKLPDGTERPLTDREVVHNARLVMIAGGGTSWRQFGIMLWGLLTHRDQMQDLRDDRSLFDQAFEESVRWNVTATVFGRLATEDQVLGGLDIPAGSAIELCTAAANRDPSRWDNPDEYDLHRKAIPHVGFGIGQHQCLGMNVARSELGVGINRLLDEFPNMRLDPDAPAPFLTGGLEQRGMSALHVLLK